MLEGIIQLPSWSNNRQPLCLPLRSGVQRVPLKGNSRFGRLRYSKFSIQNVVCTLPEMKQVALGGLAYCNVSGDVATEEASQLLDLIDLIVEHLRMRRRN